MNFSEKLIELRKKSGLSQEALGEKLNVTRQTVSKWELGQTTPSMDMLSEMSKIFNVSVDDLIKEDEKMENENNEVKVETTSREQNVKKLSKEKIIVGVLLLVLIVALAGVIFVAASKNNEEVNNKAEIVEEDKSIIERFFDLFERMLGMAEKDIEDMDKQIQVSSFNNKLSTYKGTKSDFFVENLLEEIITINKTKDKKVTVVYENRSTQNETEIRNIKTKLDGDYEVIFDYDKEGYINKTTIQRTDAGNDNNISIYAENINKQMQVTIFNGMLSIYSGSATDISVENLLEEIITINKTKDKKVTVVYEATTTQNETEIRNIKSKLDGNYEVIFDYDKEGYINKATIKRTYTKFEISSFNSSLQIYAGTQPGVFIVQMLDSIVTSNKTKDRKITIVYEKTTTQDETEIKNIKKKMDTFTQYDVTFEYDELGFINKAIIEKM